MKKEAEPVENMYEQLRAAFYKLIDEYASTYNHVLSNEDWKNPFREIISKDIPQMLEITAGIAPAYKVVGSYGKGRWTTVPWIAIFDTRITASAQKGVYIVYLLNKDSKTLYLSLEVAATEVLSSQSPSGSSSFTGITGKNNAELKSGLQKKVDTVRNTITDSYFKHDANIDSGSQGYDAGTVCYAEYTLETLPDGEHIVDDLKKMLALYKQYADQSLSNAVEDWWPSEEEYTPGITKEQWIDLLNNPEIIGPVWGGALAMFYAEKEGITCAELGKKYNRNPTSISGNCTQLAKRIHKETDCHLLEKDGKRAYWPILFFGRDADRDAQGSFAWKLRPELYDALTEFGIERFLPTTTLIGTFDSWEILSADIAIKTCDKSFFEHNGSGVPRDICWFFNAEDIPSGENRIITLRYEGSDYSAKVRNDSTDRRRIQILWNAELSKRFNRYAKAEAPKAQFTRISDTVYEVSFESGGEEELTVKDTISRIKNYIEAKGFSYSDGLIENFYLSLKSKPFVILAGTSGTGKTRLVRLFAEAVGANSGNGRYKMVSVRPDWSDSSDLFGHVDLNGKFIPGAIIDFVKRAELDSTHPYFLCLDEMNLARVEYYLSDFLSVIETRDSQAGHIVSDPLVSGTYYGSDAAAAGKYGTVPFPENLYVIGTVNMDETTFPFSRKVLDRANTIEFSFVDLTPPTEWASEMLAPLNLSNGFLKTEYLLLAQCADQQEAVNSYCLELQRLNRILQEANAHVGYRVRDEVVFYLLNNKAAELLPENEAIDNEIMQKILPRIQGSSASIKNMLCELFRVCAGDYEGQNTESDLSSKMMTVAQKPDCKYPKSAQKIAFMVRRFEEDGFTSYWL